MTDDEAVLAILAGAAAEPHGGIMCAAGAECGTCDGIRGLCAAAHAKGYAEAKAQAAEMMEEARALATKAADREEQRVVGRLNEDFVREMRHSADVLETQAERIRTMEPKAPQCSACGHVAHEARCVVAVSPTNSRGGAVAARACGCESRP